MQPRNRYHIAMILSTSSLMFGLLREFMIVGMLGFSAVNDSLQLYLSIFYTIGITIDAMRLACLNLYSCMPLSKIIASASLVSLPFCCLIGFILSYATGGLNFTLLLITILGSYLNLIAALLITYKQRHHSFLPAQIINVLPNFILVPGILCCNWLAASHLVFAIVCLTSLIPVIQCIMLLCLPSPKEESEIESMTFRHGILTFVRHFSAMTSEQFYQVLSRTAFYHFGTGYLSIFAIVIRLYSAARFILIDSFIGSKLSGWQTTLRDESIYFLNMLNSTLLSLLVVGLSLLFSLTVSHDFMYSCLQICTILLFGFYFSTLVRIVYFKINHHHNHPALVMRFSLIEFIALIAALLLTQQPHYPILTLLWIGYVAKPFTQLLFLRKHYHQLSFKLETKSL